MGEPAKRVFVSYNQEVEDFVGEVCHHVCRESGLERYFHPEERGEGDFEKRIQEGMRGCDHFLMFLSKRTEDSKGQQNELRWWTEAHGAPGLDRLLFINLDQAVGLKLPLNLVEAVAEKLQGSLKKLDRLPASTRAADQCAEAILRGLGLPNTWFDDLPNVLSVSYEKELIKDYLEKRITFEKVIQGYPGTWPTVSQHENHQLWCYIKNPLDENQHGGYRKSNVRVDARIRTEGSASETKPPDLTSLVSETKPPDSTSPASETKPPDLTFPEAGPREMIINPVPTLNVAVLVSGGIAPGINAVISAIVERHHLYANALHDAGHYRWQVKVHGYLEGFRSLSRDMGAPWGRLLSPDDVRQSVRRGGSLIATARADELLAEVPRDRSAHLEHIVDRLANFGIHILYVIGGEGSMRAAHAISTVYRRKYKGRHFSIVGVPKTMDNDILWVWQSFGFLSAVEQARVSINQLATEATSNPRVCVIQLFGSASGFVVSHAALGSDVCDLALIPEMSFSMHDVCEYMKHRLNNRNNDQQRPYGLIVMAETAIPNDVEKYQNADYVGLTDEEKKALEAFKRKNRQSVGQTPDALRTAALKIVSRVLERYIQNNMGREHHYWKDFRVFTNEPRHIIRSMEPSVTDVAYGIRLGTMAVDTAMAGYTDCMVSQWLTEYVVVPLKLVVLGRKRMPTEGIFWRTVVSKTGQTKGTRLT